MYVIWNQRRNFPRGRGYRAFAFRWIDITLLIRGNDARKLIRMVEKEKIDALRKFNCA